MLALVFRLTLSQSLSHTLHKECPRSACRVKNYRIAVNTSNATHKMGDVVWSESLIGVFAVHILVKRRKEIAQYVVSFNTCIVDIG